MTLRHLSDDVTRGQRAAVARTPRTALVVANSRDGASAHDVYENNVDMRRSRATSHHAHGARLDVGVQELRAERDVLRAIQDLVSAISTD